MESRLMQAIRQKTDAALASGDLQPIVSEECTLQDAGLPFIVRWLANRARKEEAGGTAGAAPQGAGAGAAGKHANTILPGGPRDPNFNPFLSPDPALTVGPLGDHHTVILNKFPVCLHHLVLARRQFAEQLTPLEPMDFAVLAMMLADAGGLGFYNGGAAAGASQRHKHVQWIPDAAGNASLQHLAGGLPADAMRGTLLRHPNLPVRHCFVRVEADYTGDVQQAADSLHRSFGHACADLGLVPDADGLLPAFNLLLDRDWLLVVPRKQEHYQGVSLNALSFGGTLYVREPAQMEMLRDAGPLNVLGSVGFPLV